jgi:hypothetical protein
LRKLYVAQHEKRPDAELVDPVPCRRLQSSTTYPLWNIGPKNLLMNSLY